MLPDVQASPSPAAPDSQVTVKGTGFPADTDISLTFDDKDTGLGIKTNDVGSFSAPFTVPNCSAGQHQFESNLGAAPNENASCSLTIGPMITLQPESPNVGDQVTVAGNGFAAASKISLEFDNTDISDTPTTDAIGSFSVNFKVPPTKMTKHSVVATDGAGHTARLGMPLNTTPPPTPTTLTPTIAGGGWFGAQFVTFAWTDVTDPSGVSYTLEMGDNLYFFPLGPGMRKTGLVSPNVTVQLAPGTYYWRVKAVDGAGNEGQWALAPYPVKVGVLSSWYLIIGGLIFLIIFIFVVRAFFRRLRQYYK